MRLQKIPKCQCPRCRLDLGKDLDYEEYKFLESYHSKHFLANEQPLLGGSLINREFKINRRFINYLKLFYGEYHTFPARALVMNYVHFAENSRFASKPALKHWYEEIDPYYQSFKSFAENYTII